MSIGTHTYGNKSIVKHRTVIILKTYYIWLNIVLIYIFFLLNIMKCNMSDKSTNIKIQSLSQLVRWPGSYCK